MASRKKDWISVTDANDQDLDIVARPVTKNADGSYDVTPLPAGYSSVSNGLQPQDPDYVEANRGSWGNADNAFMNDTDWAQMQQYKQDFANAQASGDQAGMDAAHQAAENLRMQTYGYSGGADGSEYLPTMAYTGNTGYDAEDFSYDTAGSYVSKWQSQIDALTNAILGREAFSYNKDTDPLYQQYKESYTRGGQRGMQDTLAQVSARTGGLASSYAQSAAQQTYNNYMAALADKVPELQQLAYSMYMDDIALDRADLDMLMGLDSTDYGRWSDDRNFNYGVYRDNVADQQWQQSFDYGAAQDALAQQNWQTQFDYGVQQDALDRDWAQMQWDYQVAQDALARQDALNKAYASAAGGEKVTTLEAIYGMRNEAEVYDFLVRNNYSQGEVEDYLQYWRYNRYNKENNAVPAADKVTVPEYGNITYDEVERLVEEGALIITGMDDKGNPTYAVPNDRKNPVKLTK